MTEATNKAITRFDGDCPPTFRQGLPVHEMEELVTAEDLTYLVKRIDELDDEIRQLRRKYES